MDHVLRRGAGKGIQAIVIYPMNALANSQHGELTKFLCHGYPEGKPPVRFAQYTGQEGDDVRESILNNPPDILLTNYVMMELILTRPYERKLIEAAKGLKFLVLDELHTYRGRQGADVAMLLRRIRNLLEANSLQVVGTSATLAGSGTMDEQRKEVATVASRLFGSPVAPEHVIGETLCRATPMKGKDDATFMESLKKRVSDPSQSPATDYVSFVNDPLSSWIETTLGIQAEAGTGRLIRATPRRMRGDEGVASDLSKLTGVDTTLAELGDPRCLLLMAMKTHRLAEIIWFLALPKDFCAFLMKHAFLDQIINPRSWLERWIELDQRFWPEHSLIKTLGHVVANAFVVDLDKTLYVVRVLSNQLVS